VNTDADLAVCGDWRISVESRDPCLLQAVDTVQHTLHTRRVTYLLPL